MSCQNERGEQAREYFIKVEEMLKKEIKQRKMEAFFFPINVFELTENKVGQIKKAQLLSITLSYLIESYKAMGYMGETFDFAIKNAIRVVAFEISNGASSYSSETGEIN